MDPVQMSIKSAIRWNLTLFVSLVLVLQSARASLALCKLGVEESGCCGAHLGTLQPSCCSGGAELPEAPQDEQQARRQGCSCELFGALPTLSPVGGTEGAQLILESGHCMSAHARCARAGTPAADQRGVRPAPPPSDSPPGSGTRRCAQLGSWRL